MVDVDKVLKELIFTAIMLGLTGVLCFLVGALIFLWFPSSSLAHNIILVCLTDLLLAGLLLLIVGMIVIIREW